MDFETRAIHVGQEPDPATGAVTTPIYQTSTFAQEAVGEHKGYDYARVANPTRTALESCLASLEGAAHGHAFSSGLGAATTIVHLVDPGDHVVCVNDVYGGIYRMFSRVYEPKGAYYVMTEIDGLGWDDDVKFARYLVETIGVAVVPGSSFYADPKDGSRQVRFAFCKKNETLDEAERRLSKLKPR